MTPTVEIKCTPAGWCDACDFLNAVMAGHVRLGLEHGSEIHETVAGRKFSAYRKGNGGVFVREVMPKTCEGRAAERGEAVGEGVAA